MMGSGCAKQATAWGYSPELQASDDGGGIRGDLELGNDFCNAPLFFDWTIWLIWNVSRRLAKLTKLLDIVDEYNFSRRRSFF